MFPHFYYEFASDAIAFSNLILLYIKLLKKIEYITDCQNQTGYIFPFICVRMITLKVTSEQNNNFRELSYSKDDEKINGVEDKEHAVKLCYMVIIYFIVHIWLQELKRVSFAYFNYLQ